MKAAPRVASSACEMIRLCRLAYNDPSRIREELRTEAHGLQGWTLAWGPAGANHLQIDNLVFVARKGSGDDAELAVAVRGTTRTSLESWIRDLQVFRREPWKYTRSPVADARVSYGLMQVFDQMIKGSPSGKGSTGTGTLGNFLETDDVRRIHVTGHSQGGATSSMMAAYLDCVLRDAGFGDGLEVLPCTFAGETAGNTDFAADLDTRFAGTWRYANELDVVPRAWSHIEDIEDIYAPTIGTDAALWVAIKLAWPEMQSLGYKQPNGPGCLLPSTIAGTEFWPEVEHQHSPLTYQNLMDRAGTELESATAGA